VTPQAQILTAGPVQAICSWRTTEELALRKDPLPGAILPLPSCPTICSPTSQSVTQCLSLSLLSGALACFPDLPAVENGDTHASELDQQVSAKEEEKSPGEWCRPRVLARGNFRGICPGSPPDLQAGMKSTHTCTHVHTHTHVERSNVNIHDSTGLTLLSLSAPAVQTAFFLV
jgi:hypothetical protein